MKLSVDQSSADWFKEEVGVPEGAGVRFLAKVYGCSPINSGFSLAMETNHPNYPMAEFTDQHGIYYYIEEGDLWFFDGHDLEVVFNEQLQEPSYKYILDGKAIN